MIGIVQINKTRVRKGHRDGFWEAYGHVSPHWGQKPKLDAKWHLGTICMPWSVDLDSILTEAIARYGDGSRIYRYEGELSGFPYDL